MRVLSIMIATVLFQTMQAAGQSADRVAKVDALFDAFNKPDAPGAAVVVLKDGHAVCMKAFGLANLENHEAVKTATNFRLASFSKQFTAMAIVILAERKRLSLDDSLTSFFPEFPQYGRTITVRHLLNHTSGLLDYEKLLSEKTVIPLLDRDVLWLMQQQDKTSFAPGSRFEYSNTGYAMLAAIVEKVSGHTYAAFMKKNIFDPLGMSSSMVNERGVSLISTRAYGYSASGDAFKRTDQSLTSYVQGDGGVYSNVEDLCKWDAALYTTQLVSREMLQRAFTPGPARPEGRDAGYGFGWFIESYRGKHCVSHTGGSIGFKTVIKRFPDDRFTVIILTNRSEAEPAAIAQKIVDLYLCE